MRVCVFRAFNLHRTRSRSPWTRHRDRNLKFDLNLLLCESARARKTLLSDDPKVLNKFCIAKFSLYKLVSGDSSRVSFFFFISFFRFKLKSKTTTTRAQHNSADISPNNILWFGLWGFANIFLSICSWHRRCFAYYRKSCLSEYCPLPIQTNYFKCSI